MAGLFAAYSAFLGRHPLSGNMLQSAILFATGDTIAQQLIEKKGWKNHDMKRTGRIIIWGGGIFAPAVGAWFKVLERVPIHGVPGTVARVALDQLVAAPVVLSTFFTVMTFMEGGNLQDAKTKWRDQFFPTLKANWCLFVPFQTVNLGLIPLQYRLLAINTVNIPWNAFLSLQNSKGRSKEEALEMKMV